MKIEEQISNLLGLATRARKTITGEELVVKEIRSQKAKLVVLSNDASKNTAKKINDKSIEKNIKDFINHFPRQALHAQSLGFVHPRTKEKMFFETPLPDDMMQLLGVLREM